MTDPKRWSDDAGALGPDERRLLRAGLERSVPRGAKRAVWVGLAAQLPSAIAAATTAGAGTGTVASALGTASLLKAAGVGVLLGATTITAVTVVEHRQAAPTTATEPTQQATPVVAARAKPAGNAPNAGAPNVAREEAPPSSPPPETTPGRLRAPAEPEVAPAPPSAPSVATFPEEGSATRHDIESRRVATARSLLRSGQSRAALLVLEETRRDFPSGELSQEREALTIEALRELGQSPEARRRAAAFLARYPASPHAPIARRALE
jgi:hypothetical protein